MLVNQQCYPRHQHSTTYRQAVVHLQLYPLVKRIQLYQQLVKDRVCNLLLATYVVQQVLINWLGQWEEWVMHHDVNLVPLGPVLMIQHYQVSPELLMKSGDDCLCIGTMERSS